MLILAALAACCVVSGDVHTPTGRPIANAHVAVHGKTDRSATSDSTGHFTVQIDPGSYELTAGAAGYNVADVGPVEIDHDLNVQIALEPSDSQHLRPIGEVTIDGRLALSRGTIPSQQINRKEFEANGYDRIVDGLSEVPSVTLPRPDGGAATGPAVVALRGPDPSETLVALDGQILNDGNTGDLDLSRFPVSAFSAVDVSEGLGPRDLEGSNTIGGAVNILSLRPTRDPHHAFSLSAGAFGSTEGWLNATGTHGRFGYAFGLDDQQEQGYVNEVDALVCADPSCISPTIPQHLGSTISSRSALGNLTWTFSQNADVGLRIFSLGNQRDLSGLVNAPDTTPGAPYQFVGPGSATLAQSIRAYDVHARLPLGAGSLAAQYTASNNNIDYTGGTPLSPYDVAHADKANTVSLSWQRTFEKSDFAFGGYSRNETLTEAGVDGAQSQHISTLFVRGTFHPVERMRVSAAAYASNYTTFGSNLDGRIGVTYDLDARSVLRFSAGTGFRAPLLIERYVFPADALPPPDNNCVVAGQGNPSEKPEHATEYELGYGRKLSNNTTVDVSMYRTNLRDPIENFYPVPDPANTLAGGCPLGVSYSYPINVGNVVYAGGAIRLLQHVANFTISAQYGTNIAYPYHFPVTVSNPTSGGYLVDSAQFLGIPQQVGSLGVDWDNGNWHAALDTIFRGKNNELNQGAYTLINGGIGKHFGRADLTLAGTNLGNDVAGKFTQLGGGVPYLGNGPDGLTPLPTDRFFLEPRSFRLILTIRN